MWLSWRRLKAIFSALHQSRRENKQCGNRRLGAIMKAWLIGGLKPLSVWRLAVGVILCLFLFLYAIFNRDSFSILNAVSLHYNDLSINH